MKIFSDKRLIHLTQKGPSGFEREPQTLNQLCNIQQGFVTKNRINLQKLMPLFDRYWVHRRLNARHIAENFVQNVIDADVDEGDNLYYVKRNKLHKLGNLMDRAFHGQPKDVFSITDLYSIVKKKWSQAIPNFYLFFRFSKPLKLKEGLYHKSKYVILHPYNIPKESLSINFIDNHTFSKVDFKFPGLVYKADIKAREKAEQEAAKAIQEKLEAMLNEYKQYYIKKSEYIYDYKNWRREDIFSPFFLKVYDWTKGKTSYYVWKYFGPIINYTLKIYTDTYKGVIWIDEVLNDFAETHNINSRKVWKKKSKFRFTKQKLQFIKKQPYNWKFNYKIRPFLETRYYKFIMDQFMYNYDSDKFIEFKDNKQVTKMNYFYKGWLQYIKKFNMAQQKIPYSIEWGSRLPGSFWKSIENINQRLLIPINPKLHANLLKEEWINKNYIKNYWNYIFSTGTQPTFYYWLDQYKLDHEDDVEIDPSYITMDIRQSIDSQIKFYNILENPYFSDIFEQELEDLAQKLEKESKAYWIKTYQQSVFLQYYYNKLGLLWKIFIREFSKSDFFKKKILKVYYANEAHKFLLWKYWYSYLENWYYDFGEIEDNLPADHAGKQTYVLKHLIKDNFNKKYKSSYQPIFIKKEQIYNDLYRIHVPSYAQNLDFNLKQQIEVLSETKDAVTNMKYLMIDKNLYQIVKKAPEFSGEFMAFEIKFVDKIIELMIQYVNIYVVSGFLFIFVILFYYHVKTEITKNYQKSMCKELSNKKKVNNKFKIIKRDFYTKSNKNNIKSNVLKPTLSKQIIINVWKAQQKIKNRAKFIFTKKNFRLKFKIEAGNFYKSVYKDFKLKSENKFKWTEKQLLYKSVSKYQSIKRKYNENDALTAMYDKYMSQNILNVSLYKYDYNYNISLLSYIINKKNKNLYNKINFYSNIRDLERTFNIKYFRHYINQQQKKSKFFLFYFFITKYFKKILIINIILIISIFLLYISISINFYYLVAVVYLLPKYVMLWQPFYKSQYIIVLFMTFCLIIITISIFSILFFFIKKLYVRSKDLTNKQIIEQYYLNVQSVKQILVNEINILNKGHSMFDVLLNDQKDKLINIINLILKSLLLILIIMILILITVLIIRSIIEFIFYSWSFINYYGTSFTSIQSILMQNQFLINKLCSKLYWGSQQYDDFKMIDVLFNMQKNIYWNQWFDSQLIHWLNLFKQQVWIENRISIEKSIFYEYYLKTIDDYWFQDKPMLQRINKYFRYMQDLASFYKMVPFMYNQFKTYVDPLKNRIINIKIWNQKKKGFVWRSIYLKFRTYNWQINIKQNPMIHVYIFMIYDKIISHGFSYFAFILIILLIIYYIYLKYIIKLITKYQLYKTYMFLINSKDKKLGDIYILKYYILNKNILN